MVNGELTILRDSRVMRDDRLALMLRESAMSYAAHETPSAEDRSRLERVVTDNFTLLAPETQRSVISAFAPIKALPPKLVAYFCHEAIEPVAAPFIVHAKTVTEPVCVAIIARHRSGGRVRAVARRADLSKRTLDALRDLHDPAIDRAIELRQHALRDVGAEEPVSDTTAVPLSSLVAMAELATNGETPLFATALADATGLSMESATALCDDPTSRNLLFALRSIGFDTELGLAVFEGLAGTAASVDGAAERFRSVYQAIGADEAAAKVRAWKLEERQVLARLRQRIGNDHVAPAALVRAG